MSDRIWNFNMGRVSDADDVLDNVAIEGEVRNVSGGYPNYPPVESNSGDSTDRYWGGQFGIDDLTFELVAASERPESLGPTDIVLDLFESWYEGTVLQTQQRRLRGYLMGTEKTLDRTTDSPRTLTFVPYETIFGGGSGAVKGEITEEGAALFARTRKPRVHRHRPGGVGTSIDDLAAVRTAHGITNA